MGKRPFVGYRPESGEQAQQGSGLSREGMGSPQLFILPAVSSSSVLSIPLSEGERQSLRPLL